jgi:hypothetical protein
MSSQIPVQKLWNYCSVLRDDGDMGAEVAALD